MSDTEGAEVLAIRRWWSQHHGSAAGYRGHAGAVEIDAIVAAAFGIVQQDGLDGLTMRKLAGALGVGMASIYRIIPGRPVLVSVLIDTVLAEVPPIDPDMPLREVLARWAQDLRRVLCRHPALVEAIPADPLAGPNALRVRQDLLGLLGGSGLSWEQAVVLYTALAQLTVGATVLEFGASNAGHQGMGRAEFYGALPDQRYEVLVQSAAASHDRSQLGFEFGLRAMLEGMVAAYPVLTEIVPANRANREAQPRSAKSDESDATRRGR